VMEPVKVNQNHGMVWYIKKDRQANQVLNDKNGMFMSILQIIVWLYQGFFWDFFWLLIL
jgi:hypothetical protein